MRLKLLIVVRKLKRISCDLIMRITISYDLKITCRVVTPAEVATSTQFLIRSAAVFRAEAFVKILIQIAVQLGNSFHSEKF
ncbi:hypothetical protein NPIL_209521 [Nephila pilipes]|uniref:Uncharacterized protein n=1 Tax=Nephila pilipes TaxID=299642 RepID=A0A8X6Q2F7_NEPPI|nr:hypothetical protein NPIL_209521 [Nephila pilipes]